MDFPLPQLSAFSLIDAPAEFPIAVSSKQVRDVLKSELSTSVPVAAPVVAVGRSGLAGVLHSKEDDAPPLTSAEAVHPQEGAAAGKRPERTVPRRSCRTSAARARSLCIFSSLISALFPEVHHEAESRGRTRISLHKEKPAVHRRQRRVGVRHRGASAHFHPLVTAKTCSCLAGTSPRHQKTAAARAPMRAATPANITKPERNCRNQRSSISSLPPVSSPSFLTSPAHLSRPLPP